LQYESTKHVVANPDIKCGPQCGGMVCICYAC